MNTTIEKFLIKVKNASLAKKSNVIVKKNVQITQYLEILYKTGLILSYLIKDNTVIIYLNIIENNCLTENIKIISKVNKQLILSYKDLIRLNLKNKNLFISTTKGIVTLQECKNLKTGGLVLFSS
jgi:ribosomal protein S8